MRRFLILTVCLGFLVGVNGVGDNEGAGSGLPASYAVSSSKISRHGDPAITRNLGGDAGGSPGGDDGDEEGEIMVEIRKEISVEIRRGEAEEDAGSGAVTGTSSGSASTAEAGSGPEVGDGGDGGDDGDDSDDEDEDEEEDEEGADGEDDDDDDDEEEGDGEDAEEEGEEEEGMDARGVPRHQTHNHTAASNSSRTRRHEKQSFGQRLGSLAFKHFNSTVLPAAASLGNRTRILQKVPRKVWLPVALTALAVALRKHISVQGATSLIMFIVFVIETMMRLGLFKSSRLGMAGLRESQTPTFSFEYLNERYETDMMGLHMFLASKNPANLFASPMGQRIPQRVHKRDIPMRFPAYGSAASAAGHASAPAEAPSTAPSSAPQEPTLNAHGDNATSTETPPTAARPTVAEVLAQNASACKVTVQTMPAYKPRCFVAKIKGDTMFSMGPFLSSLVNFLLTAVRPEDEVVLLIESPGGAAHEYGLASAQLERLRRHNIRLTICVDKVAASGGYMMACVAERLIAAPFALVGSIGVISSLPMLNVADLLGKWGIKAYTPKAGKHKGQGLLLTGDVKESQQAVEKMQEDMDKIQGSFKRHVAKYRKALDIDQVATGEVWLGSEARTLGLVDDVMTSEEYLTSRMPHMQVVHIKQYEGRSSLFSVLGGPRRRSPIPSLAAARSLVSLLSDGIKQLGGKGSMPVPYMASWGL